MMAQKLFGHPNPFAFVVRVFGETLAFMQRYLLRILNAHVEGVDACLNVRAVVGSPVPLVKHRKFAHCQHLQIIVGRAQQHRPLFSMDRIMAQHD